MISNASIDFAITADNPTMAKRMCTVHPTIIPKAEIIPALTPWPALRAATYSISLPGVRFNNNAANTNTQKFSVIENVLIVEAKFYPRK
jgi:hypothetical protein